MEFHVYQSAALKTAASDLKPEKINVTQLAQAMTLAAVYAHVLDLNKKALVYGKDVSNEQIAQSAHAYAHDLLGEADPEQIDLTAVPADVTHAILGIVTEAGELADAWLRAVTGQQELDLVNLIEEAGDVLWYLALLGRGADFDLGDSAQTNIEKLAKRYGDRFSELRALSRDLEGEREILEGKAA